LLTFEAKRRETILTILNAVQNPQNTQNTSPAVTALLNFQSNNGNNNGNKLLPSSLEKLLNFRYSSEIFNHIPINYFLIKAKEGDFPLIYPGMLR
jgi:hypothetical protein